MQITAALYDCKNHPLAQWGGRAGHNDRVSNLRLFWETGSRGAVIRQTTDYFCHIHLDCTVQKGLTSVLGIAIICQLISDIHLVARKACPLEEREGRSMLRLTGMPLQQIQDSDFFQQQSNQPPLSVVSPAASKSTILKIESDIWVNNNIISAAVQLMFAMVEFLLKSCPKRSKYCLKVGNCLS